MFLKKYKLVCLLLVTLIFGVNNVNGQSKKKGDKVETVKRKALMERDSLIYEHVILRSFRYCEYLYSSTAYLVKDDGVLLYEATIEKSISNTMRRYGNAGFTNVRKYISWVINNGMSCGKETLSRARDNEPFLKRAIISGNQGFIVYMIETEGYEINLNTVEIVNGKEETLLDYLDHIMNTPLLIGTFNEDEQEDLSVLMEILEEEGAVRKQ